MAIKTSNIFHDVDQEELFKFRRIASQWWNPDGEFKLLHRINLLRLNYIAGRSDGLFNKKILDIGCGGGILSESMAKEGAIVTGIDMSFESLQVARFHALETKTKVNYTCETVKKHAIKYTKEYDIITCMEVLEHVSNPQLIIKECAKLIKPNGHIFFSTLNRNRKSWLIAIIGAEYIFHLIPKGMHNIKKFIKPSELLNWIDQTELNEQHIIGLSYNPFTDKFYLTKDISINYILHAIS